MIKHILDTNCFYSLAGNAARIKKMKAREPKVATSIIAPLEIARISEKDFEKRQRAMKALVDCETVIIRENPDSVVRRAFGMDPYQDDRSVDVLIRAVTEARDFKEATQGFFSPIDKGIVKLHPERIVDWKKELSSHFSQAVVNGNKGMRDLFLSEVEKLNLGWNERQEKSFVEVLNAMSSQEALEREYAIMGLAIRAGALEFESAMKALSTGTGEQLRKQAVDMYNGLLDGFIKVYQEYQSRMSKRGTQPEKNALFDMEFFLHLDAHGSPLTFVTQEDLWVEVGREALPGRVISLADIAD